MKRINKVLYPTSGKVYPRVYISTNVSGKQIEFTVFHEKDRSGFKFYLPNRVSRMLARRINQYLDDCRKLR